MPAAKPLSKSDILRAMRFTKSNRAAAKYLGVCYQHYRVYAKMYKDEDDESVTLFEKHKNQCGKGIPKFLPNKRKEPNLDRIVKENIGWESFTPDKIKGRLITEGYLEDCCHTCGFNERRVTDMKVPLLLNFKDGIKSNYILENLELICYNCYFLYIADPLSINEVRHIEDNVEVLVKQHTFDMDEEHIDNMKALGII